MRGSRWAASVAVILVGGFLLGPRPDMNTTVRPVQLSPDLDAWLTESESRFPDITPGTEKRIFWADSTAHAVTPLSLVYLHGFSATRQEIRPVTERAAGQLGANAFLTRLRGHGRPGDAMAEATLGDWISDAAEAMEIGRRIGRRVVLVGTSTGATLALWTAAQDRWRDELAALVLISPNFRPADPGAAILTWPWGAQVARLVVGAYREWVPTNAVQARYWTTRYPVEALLPMAALVKAVRRLDLGTVTVPTLVVYSPEDRVVSVDAIREAVPRLAGDPVETLELDGVGDPAHHVLAGDALSPGSTDAVVAAVVDFVARWGL